MASDKTESVGGELGIGPDAAETSINRPLLPPLSDFDMKMRRKTVVLDLDGTLVYTAVSYPNNPEFDHPQFDQKSNETAKCRRYDFSFSYQIEEEYWPTFQVSIRPYVDELLAELVKQRFEIVVFTAATQEYANHIINRIDPHKTISHCLSRDSCTLIGEQHVKDLSRLGRSLERVIIVDDTPEAYQLQPDNAIPVPSYEGDPSDSELAEVITFFRMVAPEYDNVRDAIAPCISFSS